MAEELAEQLPGLLHLSGSGDKATVVVGDVRKHDKLLEKVGRAEGVSGAAGRNCCLSSNGCVVLSHACPSMHFYLYCYQATTCCCTLNLLLP